MAFGFALLLQAGAFIWFVREYRRGRAVAS
jgi:hypothetical protein